MSQIEIITIGDELVEGRLIDSNAGNLSALLFDEGLSVGHHSSMADNKSDIVSALQQASERSQAVLITGGLGPTTDDLTAQCAAMAFSDTIVRFPAALEHVQQMFAKFGRPMSPINARQADLPSTCTLISNPRGTAVGFKMMQGECKLYFMPGVPREMTGMFKEEVLPELRQDLEANPPAVGTLKLYGIGESNVGQILEGLDHILPADTGLNIQYRASFPEIQVRFILTGKNRVEALGPVLSLAEEKLQRYVFSKGDAQCKTTYAEAFLDLALQHKVQVATAESCTGGLIGQMLTAVPGSSNVYLGGVVSYANSAKMGLLGVKQSSLAEHGAVSGPVAEEMAAGIRERLDSDFAVSVTGIAGPGGGSESKPVGTVWIGIAGPGGIYSRQCNFPFDRERVRTVSAYAALAYLRGAIMRHAQANAK